MKEIGIIAALLAVMGVGAWIRSEKEASHLSEQPGTYATPAAFNSGESGATPTADGSSGYGHPGAASISEHSRLKQRLSQNEQELSSAQDRLLQVQDELQTSDLDQQIGQQQQAVMDLQARAKNMGGQTSGQLQNQAILADQDNQVLQQRITGLQQQIQSQQGVSNMIEQQIRTTIAPDDSDILVNLNRQLQASEEKKLKLRTEYESVLQQQQQLAMNRYSSQAQQQQQQQAGAVSTDVALEQAKNRLDDLNRQKQSLYNEADLAKKRVEQLQAERSSLMNQNQ
jgi:chromosome segregation ATPase